MDDLESRFEASWQEHESTNGDLLRQINAALDTGSNTTFWVRALLACSCLGISGADRAAQSLERGLKNLSGRVGSQARELLCSFPLKSDARRILDAFIEIPTEPIAIGGHPFLDSHPDPAQDLRVS